MGDRLRGWPCSPGTSEPEVVQSESQCESSSLGVVLLPNETLPEPRSVVCPFLWGGSRTGYQDLSNQEG